MIKKENYEKLKKKFGKTASWAIWVKQGDTAKSNTENMSWVTENLYKRLKPSYVFVALNPSIHEQKQKRKLWTGFHSSDKKRQQDYKIRAALKGTKFWGSYITDICKTKLETDSGKIKLSDKELEQAKKVFLKELSYLSKKVKIIAFGNKVYNILKKMNLKYPTYKITHYSAFCGPDKYTKKVQEELKELL